MTSKKKTSWIGKTIGIVLGVAMAFVFIVSFGSLFQKVNPVSTDCGIKYVSVSIPAPEAVNAFCISKGYQSGWVDMLCGEGEVRCYKAAGDLYKASCEKWNAEKK